jgi:hypothetical protein
MLKAELLSIGIKCENCGEKSAKVVKGGIISGKHGLWLLCEECLKLLKDRRL